MYPIAKPTCLHDKIFSRSGRTGSSLQEQMHFENSPETFARLVHIIRHTAANHIDLTLPYRWQDPRLIETIRQEVLAQCPTLDAMYVGAWPITSYLQVALKKHKPTDSLKGHTGRPPSKRERTSPASHHAPKPNSTRYLLRATRPPQRNTAGAEDPMHHSLRRSSRLMRFKGGYSEHGYSPADADDTIDPEACAPDSEDGDSEEEGASSQSDPGTEGNTDGDDSSGISSDSDVSEASSLSSWSSSLSPAASDSGESEDDADALHALRERASCSSPGFVHCCAPHHERTTVSPEHPEPANDVPPMSKPDAPPGTPIKTGQRHASGSAPAGDPIPDPATNAQQAAAIHDMLLARGLPSADAEHITLVVSCLGVTDEKYLRVFARLAAASEREAWLAAIESQARVVVDVSYSMVTDLL